LLLQSAGKFLDITGVANRLNMSERTLRRKLNAESLNFRIIADEVKDRLARDYLTKTTLTVADIAHLLSYSETVNFRRAFVRWNGITPNKYRLKHTNLT
jgi:AraC-like DNA-binding protein